MSAPEAAHSPIALHRLEAIDQASGRVNVVIDTPRGSRGKYKYEERTGLFRLRKLLPLGMCFPYNFGFIPSTRAEDGDALDVLIILMDEPAVPGCIVPVRLIGVLTADQTEKGKKNRNDRLLGVLATDYNEPTIESIDTVNTRCLKEIEQFFIFYNQAEGRRFEPTGRYGPDKALALVKEHGIPAETA